MRAPESPGGGARVRSRFRAGAALAAGLISVALGLFWTPPTTIDNQAAWVVALGGLEQAPVPAGTRLVLAPPAGTPRSERAFWLYEARWRRPDLLWSAPEEWPLAEPPRLGMAVGLEEVPAGWLVMWRQGDLCLARRGEVR